MSLFGSRAHFCHAAPMEMHAFGSDPGANAPEGSVLKVQLKRCHGPKTTSYQCLSG